MAKTKKNQYEPIENYGVIGDLHTIALVSIQGSIDFMSFTRFDSPTVFGRLLDAEKGGQFSIRPLLDDANHKQIYLPDTAILLTRFLSEEGIAELTDYMPVDDNEYNCTVIRTVTTVRGCITYRMECAPRFNYALEGHTVKEENNSLIFKAKSHTQAAIRLISNIPLKIKDNDGYAEFTLKEGETAHFMLEAVTSDVPVKDSLEKHLARRYQDTTIYWKQWIDKSQYRGRWREIVKRSALTLKLLTSYKYGSIIAAGTFGLPESVGGIRNWDYRYTWIRDAAFSMYAFLLLGFKDEATAFIKWIEAQCMSGSLQLMYAVDGSNTLTENELDHLEGYKGSKPVRVGNAAYKQSQLDIYGELIDTVYLYNKHVNRISYDFWLKIQEQVEIVIERWQEPDHGIWEIRSEEKHFLHSRLLCWVAMDRAIKIAEDRSFPYPAEKWAQVRNDIFEDIYANFWNEEKQTFIQYIGTDKVDASVLLMPLLRFISPVEKKWLTTLMEVERRLKLDVLLYRYRNGLENIDGLHGDEGTFTMCSFWYVECLAKSGQVDKAREHFEKMLGYANHLGLYAEQIGKKGEHLGNFPQAFTHLALISAAFELDKALDRAKNRK